MTYRRAGNPIDGEQTMTTNTKNTTTAREFAYTTKYRPISVGFTVPRDGWVSEPADPKNVTASRPFGVIRYSRELTKDELEAFEMVRVPELDREIGGHVFERADLGRAPFRCIGVVERTGPYRYTDPKTGITTEVGSPGQAMGCCKFCGQGIRDCFVIKSSDGKTFDVGCECVRKTGDAGLIKVANAAVAKKRREQTAQRGATGRTYLAGLLNEGKLDGIPHPFPNDRLPNRTMADYVAWILRPNMAGNSKIASVAARLRKTLGTVSA